MRLRVLTWLLILTLFPGTVPAKSRLVRHFDQRAGLPVSSVASLAQDRDGFLWIGTDGGLIRYDGREMRPWGREATIGRIDLLVTGPGGEVIAREHPENRLFRVAGGGLEPVAGPEGAVMTGVRDATYASDGSLHAIRGGSLFRREPAGPWTRLPFSGEADEQPALLRPDRNGDLLLVTSRGLRRVRNGAIEELFLRTPAIRDALSRPGGSMFLLQGEYPCRVLEFSGGRTVERAFLDDRPIRMVIRRGTIWVAFSRSLMSIRRDGTVEIIREHEDFKKTGGPVLVDDEGSLWIGNYLGLFQFPEPDTVVFTQEDGLPSEHARFLLESGERIWVATWNGIGVIGPKDEVKAIYDRRELIGREQPCSDAAGRLWLPVTVAEAGPGAHRGILEITGSETTTHSLPADLYFGRCAEAANGTVWIPAGGRILKTPLGSGRPATAAMVPESVGSPGAFLEDRSGLLWAGGTGSICHAKAEHAMTPEHWVCEKLPAQVQVKALLQLPSGSIWAATSGGVLRRRESCWEVVPAAAGLPSSWAHNLVRSTGTGVWVTGHGTLIRVSERTDRPAGWEVLESPGAWHGVPAIGGGDVLEAADGSLWLATSAGVVHVPASARESRPLPPRVRLVDIAVDGSRLPLDPSPEIPYSRNRLELSFAALSFRDPSLIRYKIRSGPDAPWVESRQPGFRFFDLPPGDYQPEVIASLDGITWSKQSATFRFTIQPPWYKRGWVLTLFGLCAAAVLYLVFRLRVAVLLRMERQRTGIAMDLHDELGAGLGSIGLLADLVAEERLPGEERRHLTGMISETVDELGNGLTDIIWSLRSRSERIEALGAYLVERCNRLIPGRRVRLRARFPERWPDVRLSLAVRRNLQRIAIEAVHNVVKHASAQTVEIGLAPEGNRWRLWVEDDGRGMPESPVVPESRGLGLESMRRRSKEIDAEIRWEPGESGGTRVVLRFDPKGRRWRGFARRRSRSGPA